jgi:transcriptional regulator with XRE-family HTH domain
MIKEIDARLGEGLRNVRQRHGLTQGEVGDIIGVSFQQVQKYEKGINRMSAARLYVLARYLGVSLSCFFQGTEKKRRARLREGVV